MILLNWITFARYIQKININHIQIQDEAATKNTGVISVETFRRGHLLHILKTYKNKIPNDKITNIIERMYLT